MSDHARLHRIEMNVPKKRYNVAVGIDQLCPVASLEQMSARPQLSVPVSRVLLRNPLHYTAQWMIPNLHERMQVISHPAKCMHSSMLTLDHIRDNLIQSISIGCAREQRFAMIASQDHMIEPTWNV